MEKQLTADPFFNVRKFFGDPLQECVSLVLYSVTLSSDFLDCLLYAVHATSLE